MERCTREERLLQHDARQCMRDMHALLGENDLRQVNIGSFVVILYFNRCETR